ncbi:hypothetical protein O6P43_001683 [Quillaja saponaria]|uniref:Uncharacterized protein n=1 Tax=Quillaja saponaria TaxID=32244 RepID=A0AAD7QJI5_QUISA|nr:hypothetical protein O6P43_001683 [Quillaja saponaria]
MSFIIRDGPDRLYNSFATTILHVAATVWISRSEAQSPLALHFQIIFQIPSRRSSPFEEALTNKRVPKNRTLVQPGTFKVAHQTRQFH